jgi:hypothetical protein
MNITPRKHPVKAAVFSFLGALAILTAIAVASRLGALEAGDAKRAIGLAIGAMIIAIGNSLPKLRPLSLASGNSKASAAERFAGWILVLAGIVYIALFAFAPLEQARRLASIIGIGTLLAIAVNWTWLAQSILRRRQIPDERVPLSKQAVEKRKLTAYLLLAFFYVFATACVKFLFDDKAWALEFASWLAVGFTIIYAGFFAVVETRCSA